MVENHSLETDRRAYKKHPARAVANKNVFALFYASVVLFEMLLMPTMASGSIYSVVGSFSWLIVFNLALHTYVIYKLKGLVNFLYAFVAFYYVFHFGQVVMMGIFPNYEYDYVNYITTYMLRDGTLLFQTLELCVNCINIFVLGAILYSTPSGFKNVFYLLFSVRILLDVIDMTVSFYLGYSGTFESFLPGVFSALGIMAYSVVPLYYLSLETPKKKKHFLIFILIYLFITMLSGNRGHQMVCIVGLMIVYVSQIKLNPKNLIIIGVATIFGLFFVDFIFDLRAEGLNAYMNSSTGFESKKNSNIILETIGTFGETIYTPYLVLESYKSISPFWGECFVKSLAQIVPDFFGTFKDINNEAVFAKMVAEGHTIGGSFAGEMYYNFGNTYYILTLIIGYIFSSLSSRVSYYLGIKQLDKLYMILPICVLFLWWIRDSIGNMTREIVWLYLLFVLFKSIVGKKRYA